MHNEINYLSFITSNTKIWLFWVAVLTAQILSVCDETLEIRYINGTRQCSSQNNNFHANNILMVRWILNLFLFFTWTQSHRLSQSKVLLLSSHMISIDTRFLFIKRFLYWQSSERRSTPFWHLPLDLCVGHFCHFINSFSFDLSNW